MGLRDFFSRRKDVVITTEENVGTTDNKIKCDSTKLRRFINSWTRNEGWKFENFADFMELIGVETPAIFTEFDDDKYSFKCTTASGKEMNITLVFGGSMDYHPEIRVIEGEEVRCYITNSNIEKGIMPKVILQRRSLIKNGKFIECYYSEYFCHRTVKIDKMHTLTVKVDRYRCKEKFYTLRNYKKIEEYLLSLDSSLVVDDVYNKIIRFLDFSEEDVSKCSKILVSFTKVIGGKKRVLGELLMNNGIMQEYAISEDDETYHVFKDGSWKCVSSEGTVIAYISEEKKYVCSMAKFKNVDKNLNRVQRKISELKKRVE